ncbi:MAG TPA: PQQ-binding-like beta-propeller repeat protein [candidate division Zixibacteria bacterium]|nr:PQQ-binding-like beta-propeller repeat protein [candidate division Zixibacteria bacterium]
MFRTLRPVNRSAIFLFIVASLFITGCGVSVANTNWPGLSASGDVAYVAFGSSVIAVDVVNQEQVWSFPAEPQANRQFYAAPSVVERDVVIGDYGQSGGIFSPGIKVSVLGLEQGESSVPSVVWTSAESLIKDRIIAPPLQVGSQVFVGTADNYIYALDASNNGALQWQFETGHSIWGQPTYEDGILYVSSLDKSLYALDAETGDKLWESTTGGSISDRAKLDGDLVYISSFDRMIHAVEKDSGDVRWTADSEAAVWGAPAFEDDAVYYGDLNGNVFAVDAETGSELWTKRFDSYMVAAPVIKDGVLFASTAGLLETEPALRTGSLIALDAATGDELWREATPSPIFTTPIFIQDTVVVTYIVNNILNLVVFDTADGSDLWTFQPTTVTE